MANLRPMVDHPIQPQTETSIQPVRDVRLERSRLTDVMFLLETLLTKEETIVLRILDCLYDVGSVNLINQKVRRRPLNRTVRWIARYSKPVFKVIALRWVKRNCPRLITEWLYTQVKFEPKKLAKIATVAETESDGLNEAAKIAEVVETTAIKPAAVAEIDLYRREVNHLHTRVRLLTTLLIGVTVTLGTGLAWSLSRNQTQTSHLDRPAPAKLADQAESCIAMLQPCH